MGKSFLAGLIVGLEIGGTAGFFIGHFWGWLVIGLAIAFFHRPIANFMIEQEASLVVLFRQRGVVLPSIPRRETVHTLYFLTGIVMALLEVARIWFLAR